MQKIPETNTAYSMYSGNHGSLVRMNEATGPRFSTGCAPCTPFCPHPQQHSL